MIIKSKYKKYENKIVFLLIVALALLILSVNLIFSTNIYFNGDEGGILEHIILFTGDWHPGKIGVWTWKRSLPLFPIPFLEIFGFNLVGWRIAQASMIALSFFVGYYFARKFFCRTTAWVSAVLLLVYPGFILYLFNEYPFIIFLISLSLLLFTFWYKTKRRIYAFLLFFTLGFGIFTDLVMIYTLISLLLGYFVISFFDSHHKIKIRMNRNWLLYFICFLIGISPMIYINLYYTHNYQFTKLYEGVLSPQRENYNNLAVFENVGQVFAGLNNILIGVGHQWVGYEQNPVNIPLFYLACLILIWMRNKKDYFLLAFSYVFLFLLTFQPQCFKSIHITFVIIPLIIIIARFMAVLIKSGKYKVLGLILFLVFIITNLASLSISFANLTNQEFLEHQDVRKAFFNARASMKYGEGNVYLGDRMIAHHIRIRYPEEDTYLCADEVNLSLEDRGLYGRIGVFHCSFENKTDKNALYFFQTNEFMEAIMGEEYYKRDISIKSGDKWYYYPFYSFTEYLNERNMSLILEDEIKTVQGETMFEIYKIAN